MSQAMTRIDNKAVAGVSASPVLLASTQVREAVARASLCEALDRLLTTGVVIVADATITVANIDLLRLQLQLVLSAAGEPAGSE
jgi:hypothetical protein